MTGSRPAIVHGSFTDASATTRAASAEDQTAAFEATFSQLRRFFETNSEVYSNFRRANRQSPSDLRIISPAGFHELSELGLIPKSDAIPSMTYVPPKDGGLSRPRARDPARSAANVFQVCLHSFGGAVDIGTLGTGAARSIPVDPATGYSPVRLLNGLGEFIKGSRGVGIHHLISRRGDIFNSSSWDDVANHAGGPLAQSSGARPNLNSIGIELEEWFIRHDGPGSRINLVSDRVPYTEEQLTAIAFIVKKLNTWTNNGVALRWLGPGNETVQALLAKTPGFFNHSAMNPNHGDPEGEWELPEGYQIGDPFPARWEERRRTYQKRINFYYGNYAPGTVISHWDRLFEKVNRIRTFNATTEIFDTSLAAAPSLVEVPSITSNATGGVAVAQTAVRDRVSSMQRSQLMTNVNRAEFYLAAQNQNNAVAAAFAEHARALLAVTTPTRTPPIITDAVAFDFSTGKWVTASTTINTPSVSADATESREVNTPVITPIRVGTPQSVRRYGGPSRSASGSLVPSAAIAAVLDKLARDNPDISKGFIYAMAEKESSFTAGGTLNNLNGIGVRPGYQPEHSIGLYAINIRPDVAAGVYVREKLAALGKSLNDLYDATFCATFWMTYYVRVVQRQAPVRDRTGIDKLIATRARIQGWRDLTPTSKSLNCGAGGGYPLRKFLPILIKWMARWGEPLTNIPTT